MDPSTFTEAMIDMDKTKWTEAINFEMESMKHNGVWTIVEPPEGIKSIGDKWVYKR